MYCHLCQTEVSATHDSSSGHRAARELAAAALDRLTNHLTASGDSEGSEAEKSSVKTPEAVSFCDTCNAIYPINEQSAHYRQKKHALALISEQEFEELVHAYIGGDLKETASEPSDDVAFVDETEAVDKYTCQLCALEVPRVFKAEHERSSRHRASRMFALAAARRARDVLAKDKSGDGAGDAPKLSGKMMKKLLKAYTGKGDEVENTEEPEPKLESEPESTKSVPKLTPKQYFTDILPFLPYVGTISILYIDNTEFVAIKIGNETLKIHVNNLNGLCNMEGNGGYFMSCKLCDGSANTYYSSIGQQDKCHIMSLGHIKNVMSPIDNVHLIRKIDDTHYLCGLCNVHIYPYIFAQSVENHIYKDSRHSAALIEALERGKDFKETKDHIKIMIYTPSVPKPIVNCFNQNKWPFGIPQEPKHTGLFGLQNYAIGTAQNTGFGTRAQSFGSTQNTFGSASAQNAGFGNAQNTGFDNTQNTGFGSTSAQSTAFGSASAQNTGFGSNSAQNTGFGNTQNTGFGSASTQSTAFGSASTQNTGFGSKSAQNTGSGSNSAQNPGFGSAQTSAFGSCIQSKGSLFGSTPNHNNTGSISNAPNNATGFGATQNNATGFGLPKNNATGFGASSNNTSVFGASPSNATGVGAAQNNTTGFGAVPTKTTGLGAIQNNATSFGVSQNVTRLCGTQSNAAGFGASPNNATGLGTAQNNATIIGAGPTKTTGFGATLNNATGFGVSQTVTGLHGNQNNATGFGTIPNTSAIGVVQNTGTAFSVPQNKATGFGDTQNNPSGFGATCASGTVQKSGFIFAQKVTSSSAEKLNEDKNGANIQSDNSIFKKAHSMSPTDFKLKDEKPEKAIGEFKQSKVEIQTKNDGNDKTQRAQEPPRRLNYSSSSSDSD